MRPDAPPTPEEIARAFVLAQAQADAEPTEMEDGNRLALRIHQDYLATVPEGEKGPGLLAYIANLAETESVTNEGRGPDRAFWSYVSQLDGVDEPVPNRFLARACGESRGLQVLEDTPAGHLLNAYCLSNVKVVDSLAQHFDFEPEDLDAVHGTAWDRLSERYAEATTGTVVAFAADITKGSVLGKTEVPELLRNAAVGKDGIKFATPLPRHEHLPADIDAFITNDPVRCQLVMEDYHPDASPRDFAAKLEAIDVPEDQKEARAAIVERLSQAAAYPDLVQETPEPGPKAALTDSFLPGMNVGHSIVPAARGVPTGHGAGAHVPPTPQLAPKPAGVEH
ncbi:hypothetical protein [Streptomyces sp. NPDC058874]|uniref:hypothetical protein n=1 Tax=unclassified Streptomyces TaxID=2593676 RepID=UPI003691C27E